MSDRLFVTSFSTSEEVARKARELGDGNMSKGIREAVLAAHLAWEREQIQYWIDRAKESEKEGGAK